VVEEGEEMRVFWIEVMGVGGDRQRYDIVSASCGGNFGSGLEVCTALQYVVHSEEMSVLHPHSLTRRTVTRCAVSPSCRIRKQEIRDSDTEVLCLE
jgi:hypothetical protein